MKNVLSLNGELLGLQDLNSRLCQGEEPIEGLISVKEGVMCWFDSTEVETKEECEENGGEVMEYIKLDNVKSLYTELINDIDEVYEEMMQYKLTEDDKVLQAVTRSTSNNTVYIYNYNRDETGAIEKNQVMVNKSMLSGLFQVA